MNCQRGAATVYFLVFFLALFGLLVMATDVGRLYLIQGELQTAADAAALACATQLAGTEGAVTRAGMKLAATFDATTSNDNRFNLRMTPIGPSGGSGLASEIQVDYFATLQDALSNANGGQSGGLDWSSGIYPKYARIQINAQAPVIFVPLMSRSVSSLPTVAVSAVAGMSMAMCTVCGVDGLALEDRSGGADPIDYGFLPGEFYTLYLSTAQQWPNRPASPAPMAGTIASLPYVLLNHVPNGRPDLDLEGMLFQLGAGGISTGPDLTPPGSISVGTAETGYPDLRASSSLGATIGQAFLCGLNSRFGVEPAETVCGNLAGGEYVALSQFYGADTDVGGGEYAAGPGLQDFATEYEGSMRRVLTVTIVDSGDSLGVMNFRQFLVESSPAAAQGLNPALVSGAFRAQYIGTPVPLHCGSIGGPCTISRGVGRSVIY